MWICFIKDVPGDGTCMYHSVALGIPQYNGHNLRKLVYLFMTQNLENELHGQTIRNWIEWDYAKKAENYLEDLRNGSWGGALELTILATIFRTPIYLYVKKGQECIRISESLPDTKLPKLTAHKNPKPFICVFYNGKNHYMGLLTRLTKLKV